MSGGELTNALLALAGCLACTLFGTAMIYGALWITDAGKVVATREKMLGGGSGLREPRPVTNANELGIQTNQTNSTTEPRFSTGQGGK